jgi:hypothetical protein
MSSKEKGWKYAYALVHAEDLGVADARHGEVDDDVVHLRRRYRKHWVTE